MAEETAATPTTVAPPPGDTVPGGGPVITRQEGRRALAEGLAALARGASSNGPLDSAPPLGVSSAATATAAAAPPPSTALAEASTAPPVVAPAPAPVSPAAAPPVSPAATAAGEARAPADDVTPPPVSAPAASPATPADPLAGYHSPELDALYRDDLLLRRTVARISGNPTLSEAQKAEQIATKVADARDRVRARQQAQASEEELWQAGRYEELAARREATRQAAQTNLEQARGISRLLAVALEADESDPEFQQAGPREGEPAEAGLQRFIDYLTTRSPVVAARVARAVAEAQVGHGTAAEQLRTAHETELAAVRAAHQQEVAAVRAELAADREAAVQEAWAQARGGVPLPRARVPVPADVVAGPFVPPTLREARGLLSAGLRLHDQAARERVPAEH